MQMEGLIGPRKLPRRVRRVIERANTGQRLCKSLRLKPSGEQEVLFYFEPSGRRAPERSSVAAIASGLLIPAGDGLFGDDFSQSWTGAAA